MSTHHNINIKVCDIEQGNDDWPTKRTPTPLIDVIAWFNNKLAKIPEQYRANATCEIDSVGVGEYGDYYAHIEISYEVSYERPET